MRPEENVASHKPTVGIFFDEPELEGEPFDELHYRDAYLTLSNKIEALNTRACFVRASETYLGAGVFSNHSSFDAEQHLVDGGRIKVDALYEKSTAGGTFSHVSNSMQVLNRKSIVEICADKALTASAFADLHPHSEVVETPEQLKKTLTTLGQEMVVVKSTFGKGGNEVEIGPSEDLIDIEHEFPVLVQQFVDCSKGYEGIVEGVHDLRVNVLGGDVVSTYVREAEEGSLKSNLHQGGELRVLRPDRVPQKLLKITSEIVERMPKERFSFFSADFVYGDDKWYLIELNDRPGMLSVDEHGVLAGHYLERLAKYLVDMAHYQKERDSHSHKMWLRWASH